MCKFGENLMRNEKVSFNTNFLIWTPWGGVNFTPRGMIHIWYDDKTAIQVVYKFGENQMKNKEIIWKIWIVNFFYMDPWGGVNFTPRGMIQIWYDDETVI